MTGSSTGSAFPGLNSWLVGYSTDTVVTGLDRIPDDEEAPAKTMLHLAFNAMVGIGFGLLALGAWFGWSWRKRRDIPPSKWFLRAVSVSGIGAVIALEAGWVVTEVGRQPWIVYEVMRTEDAVTSAGGLWFVLAGAVALYTVLGTVSVIALKAIARRDGEGEGVEGLPYGPPRDEPTTGGERVSKADVVAAILTLGATLYAVFAGADFGAGVWQLLASRDADVERRERIERRVTSSLGPVWEANHVWLIFVLVVLWTGFPDAFAPIMETLYDLRRGRGADRLRGRRRG